MYRLNRLNTAGHLFARFIATASASTYLKRLNQPLRYVFYKSCQEVKEVINFLKPQVRRYIGEIWVEINMGLSDLGQFRIGEIQVDFDPDMRSPGRIRLKVVFLEMCLSRAPLLTPKEYKIEGGVSEFQVAYEEAMKYGGKVVLGDVPQETTRMRTLAKMLVWQLMILIHSLPSRLDTHEAVV